VGEGEAREIGEKAAFLPQKGQFLTKNGQFLEAWGYCLINRKKMYVIDNGWLMRWSGA
jgi:hypothetical protein